MMCSALHSPLTCLWAFIRDLTDPDIHLERALGGKCPALASIQAHDTNLCQVIKMPSTGTDAPLALHFLWQVAELVLRS